MTENFTRWDGADYLDTDEDIRLYLDACVEQDKGDGALIRAALSDIARARNQSALAREVGISREGLRKALGADGNPSLALILKIARALGLELHLTPGHTAP
jgi:probable addiction module antidote protein